MHGYDDRRQPHYITRNLRTTVPSQLVFVDTESIPEQEGGEADARAHRFRLGHAITCRLDGTRVTRRKELAFSNISDFWYWLFDLLAAKRTTWLFAHSLGFDWTILGGWELIESGELLLAENEWTACDGFPPLEKPAPAWRGILVAEDPPNIWSVRRQGKALTCVDTLNYWRESLSELGKSVGLLKKWWCMTHHTLHEGEPSSDHCKPKRLPPFELEEEIWQDYCKRDCEILEKAVVELLRYWKSSNLGTFRYTAAGLSWNAYRHLFMPDRSILVHGHEAIDLERASYYGGECRSFFIGEVVPQGNSALTESLLSGRAVPGCELGPVYELDVSSLYPSVMRGNLFPCRLCDYLEESTPDKLAKLPAHKGVIAEVQILSDTDCYPVRLTKEGQPVLEAAYVPDDGSRKKVQGITRYARGHFWTALCGPELWGAYSRGHVLFTGRAAVYELRDLFTSFVDFFWESRRAAKAAGDTIRADFHKLILNSLSGKFAQRLGSWQDDSEEPIWEPWGQWLHGQDADGLPQKWRAVANHAQRYVQGEESGDSFPAISAWITALARERMRYFRQIAGERQVYYQDTDSLHCNALAFERLTQGGCIQEGQLGYLRLLSRVDSAQYFGLKHYRIGDEEVIGSIRRSAVKLDETHYLQSDFQRLPHLLSSRPSGVILEKPMIKEISLCHPDGLPGPDGWVTPTSVG